MNQIRPLESFQRFMFGWEDYPAQPDPLMTRPRAAMLLSAWRKNAQRRANTACWQLKRLAPGIYQVRMPGAESGTLFVPRKSALAQNGGA